MTSARLRLALAPTLPSRAPGSRSRLRGHGFVLRLVGGPALEHDDPLLCAFGVNVVGSPQMTMPALQHECFDPGRRVRLEHEPYEPYGPDGIGVWDLDGVRQAGALPSGPDAVVAAALEFGLPMEAVVLWEDRERLDDRRTGLTLLVHSPAFVEVAGLDDLTYSRPSTGGRTRLVLFADGSGDVRWWDPSGSGGRWTSTAVPVSASLRAALERLRDDYASRHARVLVGADDGPDRLDQSAECEGLEQEARELWLRARRELARSFAVGFLGRGMTRPVWSPDELHDDEEEADDEEPW